MREPEQGPPTAQGRKLAFLPPKQYQHRLGMYKKGTHQFTIYRTTGTIPVATVSYIMQKAIIMFKSVKKQSC